MYRSVIIFVLVLGLPISCAARSIDSSAMKQISAEELKKQFEEARKSSWELKISMDYPELNRPILFAKVDKDPMDNYKERLKEEKSWMLKTKDLIPRYIYVQNTWNTVFEKVGGVDVSYIENSLAGGQSKIHKIGSNNLSPFWLVTKAIGANDEEIAWSIHIKPKKGAKMDVQLSSKNRVDSKKLFKLYESALNDAVENKNIEPVKNEQGLNFFLNFPKKYVVYTVIDSDPLQFFKNQLRKNIDFAYSKKETAIMDNWNLIFANVDGLHVYTLGDGEYSRLTDSYESKRWVVTRAVKETPESGKVLVWSMPINKNDRMIEFNKENGSYRELERIYDSLQK